jgi:hypothetical protein
MIKDPTVVLTVHETHKIHRKAAVYAILGDLLFIVLPLVVISIVDVSVGRSMFAIIESPELKLAQASIFVLGVIVFGFFGVNGHALSLRFGGRQLDPPN